MLMLIVKLSVKPNYVLSTPGTCGGGEYIETCATLLLGFEATRQRDLHGEEQPGSQIWIQGHPP